jgi:SAM-dependent methyltransferase
MQTTNFLLFYEFLKRKFLTLLLCHGQVLDVGCGKGTFPIKRKIVGLDINKKALTTCAYEFKVVGDASYLPFKDKSFNVCIESACFSYVKNWKKTIHEMHRIAKKCYMIEQIRNCKRLHWFSLLELNNMGKIVFFVLRTFVVKVGFGM